MRGECPVHWTDEHHRVPRRGRLLVGHDRRRRPRGQPRLGDLLVRARRHHRAQRGLPDRAHAGDVHRHGPAQARPPQGAVPARLHAQADRRARGRDPRRSPSACSTASRAARPCDLVNDVAQPVVVARDRQLHGHPGRGRRDLGAADEHDARRRRPGPQPGRHRGASWSATSPRSSSAAGELIAERRENPTDDLTSVLVHAEIDGQKLEEHEIVMGFFLLVAAGNDSTKATYCSGMRALMENPEQRQLLLDDPSLVPSAVEEALRMFPAFAHFRRTATRDTELNGQTDPRGRQGRHVVRLVQPRRDALRGPRPLRRRAATPSTRRSAPAAGTSASARRWRGSSCRSCIEETLERYPAMEIDGHAADASSRRSSTSSRRCRSGSTRSRAARRYGAVRSGKCSATCSRSASRTHRRSSGEAIRKRASSSSWRA